MLGEFLRDTNNNKLYPPNFLGGNANLGSVLSGLFSVMFFIAGFLMLFWMAWGVYQYIFAGGNKDALSKARSRITWAIVGFIFFVISFFLSQYAQTIFPQKLDKGVTPITTPPKI